MRRIAVSFACIAALGGCESLNSVKHDFRPDLGNSITIDVKQRAIYALDRNMRDDKWYAVCAEPSPDGLSALNLGNSVDLAIPGRSLGLAFASAETAASIGLRTQSITILRDAMYRLCEGYASGALDDISFSRHHRRYQSIMMGLLAIEQLTGAVVARQATLGGQASSSYQNLSRITQLIDKASAEKDQAAIAAQQAKAKLDAATAAKAKADEALAAALKKAEGKDDGPEVARAKDAVAKASKELVDAQAGLDAANIRAASAKKEHEDLVALRKDLEKAGAIVSASASLNGNEPARVGLSNDSVREVSKAVEEIVKTIVQRDYTQETCLDTLTSRDLPRILRGADATMQSNREALELVLRYCAMTVNLRAGSNTAPAIVSDIDKKDFLASLEAVLRRSAGPSGPTSTGSPGPPIGQDASKPPSGGSQPGSVDTKR
jgi:hypothetical protein